MKAFRGYDGKVRIFRMDNHMKRFLRSCQRLSFPWFETDQLAELIRKLVKVDQKFIPNKPGGCLYLRPTAISNSNFLGVRKSDSVKIFVIMSPVQKYFAGDIHLGVCDFYERGGPNSCNSYKLGANYAPTIEISEKFAKEGLSQALWLNNGNILESGATNIFFLIENPSGCNINN